YGGPQLSFVAPVPRTGQPHERTFTPNIDLDAVVDHRTVGGDFELWAFRRIAARQTFRPGWLRSDITTVNWPMIDYLGGPVFGGPDDDAHLAGARDLSLSFLHWLQTEAPRPDGGTGYPGLRLVPEVVGTADGLAKRPYIRESRRIQAQHTIVEQEVALATRPDGRAVRHADSVGIGSYRIDLHPSTGGDGYIDVASCPFQIPLRSLVPVRMTNLLPAAKNIGTTHITNGCYRLHPVEWNIGEAAATLAALCLERRCTPQDVTADQDLTAELQRRLAADGVEVDWPDVRAYWGAGRHPGLRRRFPIRRAQPLTDPAVSPATIRFWNASATMIIGTVTTTHAAVMVPIGRWNSTAPVKAAIATGTVCATSGLRGANVEARRNSFHAETKMMIAAANTPGAASGRMIL